VLYLVLTKKQAIVYRDGVFEEVVRNSSQCESEAIKRVSSEQKMLYSYGYFERSVPVALSL
jgi:hypothetical protein